jgi:outer membrane protein OmpA-like peptidoglycan-associated protein
MLKEMLVVLGVAAVLLLPVSVQAADEEMINFSGQDPTEDELIDALMPRSNLRTRGIRPGAVTSAGAAVAPSTMSPPKVSFDQITFELNSDRITPRAESMLEKLGRALSSNELSDVEFLIEGHTDATGGFQYNMRLSQRRAESVKRYLVENFQLDPVRLKTIGKGPTDLLDKGNPASGRNRRVVFVPEESEAQ